MSHTAQGHSTGTRWSTVLVGVILVSIVAGLFLIWPGGAGTDEARDVLRRGDLIRGTVESVSEGPCTAAIEGDAAPTCIKALVRLDEGPEAGTTVPLELSTVLVQSELEEGDGVILEAPPETSPDAPYGIYDRVRTPALVWLFAIFASLVLVLGRLRGLGALAGLAVTLLLVARFTVPALLEGGSPLLVAAVTSGAAAFAVLYLANGFGPLTNVALLGTLGGVALALVLGAIWVPLAELTGLASEAASVVQVVGLEIDIGGLLLAGVVIGALGAIDDVAVTQASSVRELSSSGVSDRDELFDAGMRVGRDHVGSIVNTLVLAYAGASLPLLIIFELSGTPLAQALTSELVATEIVRTLVGSVGLLAAMPLTTWLAARAFGGARSR